VGKQARRDRRDDRRRRDDLRTKHAESARVADVANLAAAILSTEVTNLMTATAVLSGLPRDQRVRVTLDPAMWASLRGDLQKQGYRWPDWCYLPYDVVSSLLGREIYLETGSLPSEHDLPVVATPAQALLNWQPGRVVVRFHPDVLEMLLATPLLGVPIPRQVLYRLPAWGLYLATPQLGARAGVFVNLDPAVVESPSTPPPVGTADELVLVFVDPDRSPQILTMAVRLDHDTLDQALAADRAEAPWSLPALLRGERTETDTWFGTETADAVAAVVSMVLYLCVDDPDTATREMPTIEPHHAGTTRVSPQDSTVIEAGWRLGAELTRARSAASAEHDASTGRTVTPHLRRAHWHSYWTGPRSDPAARRVILRYVAPTIVGAHDAVDLTTVREVPEPIDLTDTPAADNS
jgi:hypothetical protein